MTPPNSFATISLMLIIRLQRVGKKNEPTFRIVLTDSKNGPKSGKFLEILGSYDARDKNETKINKERAKYWISKGAQVSGTVRNFLIDQKVIDGKKVNVLPKKTPIVKESEGGESEPKTETAPPDKEAPKEDEKVEAPEKSTETEEVTVEEAPKPVEEAPKEEEKKSE